MNVIDQTFFNLITYSLSDATNAGVNSCPITLMTTQNDWKYLHKIAVSQKLWPVIFEVVSDTQEYLSLPQDIQNAWMMETMAAIRQQVVQSEELAFVCELLESENIRYVILKGVSCRRYYPNPDARPSGDEDILIDWRDYQKCDSLLKENGYICEDEFDPDKVQDEREAHYRAANGSLYLEVHLNAIGRENQRQQRLNDSFDDALDHVVTVEYEGHHFSVLEPTYQTMHLLSHFYRHLYEAGVGIRQMLDVLLTMKAEASQIDWKIIEEFLQETQMRKIFAAVLNAGEKYFHMDLECVPENLWNHKINPEPMLEDMIEGGIYGYGEKGERKLSSNFTLDIDTKHNNLLTIVFPPRQKLADRYPVLHKHPGRYPIYVVVRWFELLKEHGADKASRERLKASVETGKKRRNLLEQYKD